MMKRKLKVHVCYIYNLEKNCNLLVDKKEDVGEIMKNLNFQSMEGCTFNINLHFNKS